MKPPILLFSVALLASGCTVGPNYKRPTVAVPGVYRGTVSTEAAPTQLAAFGDQKWWDIFQDEQLPAFETSTGQMNLAAA
jgi:outer membrane protein, multidrug efflux system